MGKFEEFIVVEELTIDPLANNPVVPDSGSPLLRNSKSYPAAGSGFGGTKLT